MNKSNMLPGNGVDKQSKKLHQKVGVGIGSALKKTHHHVAKRPHNHLMDRSRVYHRWHSWSAGKVHHGHVHGLAALVWLSVAAVFVSGNITNVFALSTWNQSDWSGGVGTNTSDEYESATNIDVSTGGQISLSAGSNQLSNASYDADLSSWNGIDSSHDTTTTYSGAGSAKIEAAIDSSNPFSTEGTANLPTTSSADQQMDSADFNNDGNDDIVIAGDTDEAIYVYESDGKGDWSSVATHSGITGKSIMDVVSADFDDDGNPDVAVVYTGTNQFSVFMNDGDGSSFTRNDYTGPTNRQCALDTGFFNDDDLPDIVITCYVYNNFAVYINDGTGAFPTKVDYAQGTSNISGGYDLTSVDLNGDGFDDIATPISTCTIRYIINNSGTGFSSYADYSVPNCSGSWDVVYALNEADLNGDQYEDLVFSLFTGSTGSPANTAYISTLFGQSSGVPTSQEDYEAIDTFASGVFDVEAADINSDGYDDIISVNRSTNQFSYYENNGDGTLSTKVDGTTNTFPVDASTGDFNGDGKIDFTVLNRNSGNVSTYISKLNGTVLNQQINAGDTDWYSIEGYAYTDGSAVTSADVELYGQGEPLTTSYEDVGAGWYKISAAIQGENDLNNYGVEAKYGKTVYIDDINLFKYDTPGTLISNAFDLSFGGDWGALNYTTSGGTVTVKARSDDSSDMSGAPDFSTCPNIASGTDLTGQTCITNDQQYIQYQITLASDSGVAPVFEDINISYDPWDSIPPSANASNVTMKKAAGGDDVSSNGWTNGASPYFAWDAGTDADTGIKGYCLYLGDDNSGDPISTKGLLGNSPLDTEGSCQFAVSGDSVDMATAGYINTALTTSDNPYYLNVKAIDYANNVFTGSSAQFQFRFDNTPPENPSYLSAPSSYINTKSATLTWPSGVSGEASDDNSGVAGMQYQINASGWYGDSHTGTGDINDLLANDGSYTTTSPGEPDESDIQEGVNLVYLRTWDNAGNISTGTVSVALKVNTSSAPSAPNGLNASPTINTTNSFAFSWSAPSSFSGDESNLTYCYTVNVTPSLSSCSFTNAGVTSLSADAYATQPGENTLYVVAKDEAGNINYSNRAEIAFFANTPAPGVTANMDVLDASIKSTSNWRLAVTWDEPADVGSGISSYQVYRSTDDSSYSLVGSSTSTTYVDAGLSQVTYYYKVKACDSANQCSAFSSSVSELPTGKFTEPAEITSSPLVSNITTKRARISWSTDRASDSKIAIGTSSGKYGDSEIGSSSQVTSHIIDLDNLAAGTTYYAKAKWTDEDGNTGQSQEFTFKTAPAPVLKEVEVQKVNLSGATIKFTTRASTRAILYYGKSEAFGGVTELNTALSESTYTIGLEGLDDGSKYLFKIGLFDTEGTEYQSSIFTFDTPPRPRINNLRFQPVDDEPTSTQKITWTTNVPTTSGVTYGQTGTNGVDLQSNELKTSHTIIVKNLADDSEYFLIANGRDADGNLATSDRQVFRTALDTRPPSISGTNVEATIRGTGSEARGQIIVSWTTDEPATSQVAYAEGSNATVFNNRTSEDATLTTEHIVIISDLQTSKAYTIQPVSSDNADNESQGTSTYAIVGRASDGVLDLVLNALRSIFGF